jgi:hypothetical protein
MKAQAKSNPVSNLLVTGIGVSLEILVYALIFLALEDATIETAFKAGVVLCLGVRLFVSFFSKKP